MACGGIPGAGVVVSHEIEEGDKGVHDAEVESLDLFGVWKKI